MFRFRIALTAIILIAGLAGAPLAKDTLQITIGAKSIQAVLANTDATRIQGLLGWDSITDDTGMLLDFIQESEYAIHMNGMKFAIDAVWIDNKGAIKLIYEEISPDPRQHYPSMFPSRYCLELKA